MRLAFFGGSFDPPHLGHLHIARTASQRLALDQVLLAPVGRQPLKSHHPAPFADRLAMLALLTAPYPELVASPIDSPRPDAGDTPNYSVDTLARLRLTLPAEAELFFLAGADSFLTLPHWRRPEALLQLAVDPAHPAAREPAAEAAAEAARATASQPESAPNPGLLTAWILAARPGFPLASLAQALPPGYSLGAPSQTPGPVLTQPVFDPEGVPATPLHLLPDLEDPSTATTIREAFAAGREAPHLTPQIARYIRDHGLYSVLR